MFDKNKRFEFRGYDKDLKKWFYGGYIIKADYADSPFEKPGTKPAPVKHFIVFEEMVDWGLPTKLKVSSVDKDSVGQCTGLKDKNGKLIYEGDILCHPQLPHKVVCEWFQCGFWLNGYQNGAKRNLHDACKFYEVIGNIYENKELLEDEE